VTTLPVDGRLQIMYLFLRHLPDQIAGTE
jgi:hypothetical protein